MPVVFTPVAGILQHIHTSNHSTVANHVVSERQHEPHTHAASDVTVLQMRVGELSFTGCRTFRM
jgi:hypothetical protein